MTRIERELWGFVVAALVAIIKLVAGRDNQDFVDQIEARGEVLINQLIEEG